jgi:hypothetical protein
MAHASLKLLPGVDTTKTPALNEAAVSQSNAIRFLPDAGGKSYAQKLGGWTAYYGAPMPTTVRALKSWEDLNQNLYLGIGCEGGLYAIRNGQYFSDISPRTAIHSTVTIDMSYTAGSTAITVNDPSSNANTYSFVYFNTPISVGGTKLYGAYTIDAVNSTSQYVVNAEVAPSYNSSQTATISNASPAVITVAAAPSSGTIVKFTTTGTLPTGLTVNTPYFVQKTGSTTFNVATTPTGTPINTSSAGSGTHTATFPGQTAYATTTANSPIVNALFPDYGLGVGDAFGITVPLSVGGISLYGSYDVSSVVDANNFQFIATDVPASSASAFENNDQGVYVYYYSAPPNYPTTAYGAGDYSSNAWGGTGTSVSALPGTNVTATDWSLDNWGNTLIACPAGGPIYAWIPQNIIQNAFYLDNAPLVNDGVFVAMPQRQLVAWGTTFTGEQDPLLIRWSDIENYNLWIAETTNQAGSYRIPTGSRIIACIQAMQQGLIWTDLDLYSMQYVGYPLVYGFTKIGSNCGLISRKAAGQLGNSVYWMSQKQFFTLSSQGVQSMVCPVWDVIFQDLDTDNANKIRCAPNTAFNEITWYYVSLSGGTGEVDSYVKYNTLLQTWDYGSIGRTAWIDQSQLGLPIGAGVDKNLYQHETSNSANGAPLPSSLTTGYFAMQEGDQLTFVDQIWPDMKFGQYNQDPNATVYLTINSVNYPGDTPISYGPYSMTIATKYISTRVRGRLFSFTIQSTDANSFWRLGNIRYRVAPDGKY